MVTEVTTPKAPGVNRINATLTFNTRRGYYRYVERAMIDEQRIPRPQFPDVQFRHRPNWTAAGFLGLLGAVHLAIALRAALQGRWEGSLSFLFGAIFIAAAVATVLLRREIGIQVSRERIAVRFGIGRWISERWIPFADVSAVKLTLAGGESRIEIVCHREELECPPTRVPRQEALFIAMMLGVNLLKIGEGTRGRSPIDWSQRV